MDVQVEYKTYTNMYTIKKENKKLSWAVISEILKIFSLEEKMEPMGKGMLCSKKLKYHKNTQKMLSLEQTPWHSG